MKTKTRERPSSAKHLLAACLLIAASAERYAPAAPAPAALAITSIAGARNNNAPASASASHPVKLRGIVTAFSGWKNSFFLQDESGAISVDRLEETAVRVGDHVEVSGTIRPGSFAPILLSNTVQLLAPTPSPKPRISTYYDLSQGKLDSRWIEVSGVVHSARTGEIWGRQVLFLDLHTLGGKITVHVIDFPAKSYDNLVDSTVRIRGVCGTIFNNRQQLTGVRLFVPDLTQIRIESPPAALSSVPRSPLESLLRFNPEAGLDHRARVAGAVTFQAPGGLLYLQNKSSGIRVETRQTGVFEADAQVEAYGFVTTDGYSPSLEDAIVQRIGPGRAPPPVSVQAAQVIGTKDGFAFAPYDSLLVHIEGKIIERVPQTQGQLWVLQDKKVRFQAELSQLSEASSAIAPGSLVGLTGICRTETDSRHNPASFRILLRTERDITVLLAPYSRVSAVFLSIALVFLLSAGLLVLWLQAGYSRRNPQPAEMLLPDRRSAAFAGLSKLIAMLVGGLGALVLVGWATGASSLKSVRPDYVSMKANAALAFLAAAVALWLKNKRGVKGWPALGSLCAALTAAIGALTLLEYATGWNLHIDELLFRESGLLLATTSPGRMALVTAFCFFLLGSALVMVRHARLTALAQVFALLTGAFCLLSVNSYLYGIHDFQGFSLYVAMAVHSSLGMLLLSLGVLFGSANRGLMQSISSPAPGGVMAIRLLPCALLAPPILGWIRWQGQLHGLYDSAFGLALFVSANDVCFAFLIWTSASLLNRLDLSRSQAEAQIRGFNETLEARVAKRTAELNEAKERFRSLIDGVKDYSILTLDPNGNITTWNAGAERLKGYKEEEILGKHFAAFYSREDREIDLPAEELRIAQATGQYQKEGWHVRKDGSMFWANVLITAVQNEDGALRGFSKITQDITGRKRAEERFRLVVEACPNAVMMIGSDGLIELVNLQTEKLFGYERRELLGQPVEMLVPRRMRPEHTGYGNIFFTAPTPRSMEMERDLFGLRKDGTEVPIEIGLNPISSSEGSFVLASIIDISERKKAERLLRDQALILDLASDSIFIRDREGRITYWNQGAERLYGWSKEEAVGHITHALLRTQFPRPLDEIEAQLATESHWKGELIHTRRDGTLLTVGSTWTLQRDHSNRLSSVLELNHDVTDQKRAEAALFEARQLLELRFAELQGTNTLLAQKNEEVEAFVYIVSHDLRAPLVNLQGFCKELELSCAELQEKLAGGQRQPSPDPRVQTILNEDIPDSLRYISASTSKFHRLINALIELSRYGRQEYHPEELDLEALVQSTLDLVRLSIAASGIQVSVSPIPNAYGDATALGQVFSNLIGNSIKYLQPGRPGRIEIGGKFEDGEAHYWVRDNGAGLPPSAQTRLFQVFQRFHPTLAPGEGMGLAIVKRIIERHGGRIWAEGEEGAGTTFHFTLPSQRATRE